MFLNLLFRFFRNQSEIIGFPIEKKRKYKTKKNGSAEIIPNADVSSQT